MQTFCVSCDKWHLKVWSSLYQGFFDQGKVIQLLILMYRFVWFMNYNPTNLSADCNLTKGLNMYSIITSIWCHRSGAWEPEWGRRELPGRARAVSGVGGGAGTTLLFWWRWSRSRSRRFRGLALWFTITAGKVDVKCQSTWPSEVAGPHVSAECQPCKNTIYFGWILTRLQTRSRSPWRLTVSLLD